MGILGSVRVKLRLLDILDGDEADAATVIIDDEQLFDAVRMQQALGFGLFDAILDRDEVFLRHQFVDLLRRIGSEADIAVRQNADETARTATVFNDRNAGNAMRLHQRQCFGQRRVGADRHRVDDHAAFELLDLTDLFGLFDRGQVAVDDTHAAGLCHGNGKAALGDGVHRRGHDRQGQVDVAGHAGRDVGLSRHDFGMAWLQQDIVKCQRL